MSENYHNKGEQDAKEGKYEPPHSVWKEVFGTFAQPEAYKEVADENESYNKGWQNTKKQIDT